MIKVMFVCHGNICRSPMAEFVFKDMVERRGLREYFYIASSATSTEEIGNSVHPGTRNKLKKYGVSTAGKCAVQLTKRDYKEYDYIVAMDRMNVKNILRIIGNDRENKVKRLLDYSKSPRDIADPWYTGNFDLTYDDVYEGCEALLEFILHKENIS